MWIFNKSKNNAWEVKKETKHQEFACVCWWLTSCDKPASCGASSERWLMYRPSIFGDPSAHSAAATYTPKYLMWSKWSDRGEGGRLLMCHAHHFMTCLARVEWGTALYMKKNDRTHQQAFTVLSSVVSLWLYKHHPDPRFVCQQLIKLM